MRVETYEQAIEYLYSRINYERFAGNAYSATDFKLDRMRELLARLDNPQDAIPALHIAGTKGKGSTAAMSAAVLTAAGCRTGLFTSPHITAFEERLVVDGHQATPRQIVQLVNQVAGAVADLDAVPGQWGPTYFEIATAMAWLLFRESGVQVAVLEVGLGGRLDATNVCRPLATVITSISRDHTRQLGSRIEQIALEKAGIVKPGVPMVSGATHPAARETIARVCDECGAPLLEIGRDFEYALEPGSPRQVTVRLKGANNGGRSLEHLPLSLLGDHQAHNLAVAVAALDQLERRGVSIPPEAYPAGLEGVRWPGRVEVVRANPTVVVDTAHNWASTAALLKTLQSFPAERRILVFAATRDKDVAGMLRQLLPRFDTAVLTSYANNPRGVPVAELIRLTALGDGATIHSAADVGSAWKLASRLAGPADLICITGSFFIAAEMRELLGHEDARADSVPSPTGQPGSTLV